MSSCRRCFCDVGVFGEGVGCPQEELVCGFLALEGDLVS